MKTSTPEVVGRPEAGKIRIDALYRFAPVEDIPTPITWDMKDGSYVVLRDQYSGKVVAAGRDTENPTGDLADPGVNAECYEPIVYYEPTGEGTVVLWVHLPHGVDSRWLARILDPMTKHYRRQIKELKLAVDYRDNSIKFYEAVITYFELPWYKRWFTERPV